MYTSNSSADVKLGDGERGIDFISLHLWGSQDIEVRGVGETNMIGQRSMVDEKLDGG